MTSRPARTALRSGLLALLLLLALVLGLVPPAHAGGVRVGDRDRQEIPGMAISQARFTYGAERVSAVVGFSALSRRKVDEYVLEVQNDGGRAWQLRWRPREGERSFTTFVAPGGTGSQDVRCEVQWRQSFARKTASVSFPTSCLRRGRTAAPARLKMGFLALDNARQLTFDAAPGSNSPSRGVPAFTRFIRKG